MFDPIAHSKWVGVYATTAPACGCPRDHAVLRSASQGILPWAASLGRPAPVTPERRDHSAVCLM